MRAQQLRERRTAGTDDSREVLADEFIGHNPSLNYDACYKLATFIHNAMNWASYGPIEDITGLEFKNEDGSVTYFDIRDDWKLWATGTILPQELEKAGLS